MKSSFFVMLMMTGILAHAQVTKSDRERARALYLSLSGVTPSKAELDLLEAKMRAGAEVEAAKDIIDERNGIKNNGSFYSATVKDMVTPWTSKSRTTLAPLNDMSATIIGWVRDEKQFNRIMYSNSVYKASGVTFQGQIKLYTQAEAQALMAVVNPTAQTNQEAYDYQRFCRTLETSLAQPAGASDRTKIRVLHANPANPNNSNDWRCRVTSIPMNQVGSDPRYLTRYKSINALYMPSIDEVIESNLIITSNDHYESISALGLNLGDRNILTETTQDSKLHQYPAAISGILSTRAYGAAYLYAGTNRAPVAYAMENFLCKSMESLNDTTIPDFRNRRDVDRSPGGTSSLYKNRCIGCHAGMDGLAGAFAYYDYVGGKVTYTPGNVVSKMNHNVFFADGYVTQSDQWINLWTEGQNSKLGWGPTTIGEGVKSFGIMLSQTEAFHSCMATQVYEKVCNRKALTDQDRARIAQLTTTYKNDNFNMKKMFINASLSCLGD